MKIAGFLIVLALPASSCAVNEEFVKNQIGANTNRTAPTSQNADIQSNLSPVVKKEVDYFAHLQPEQQIWKRRSLRNGLPERKNLLFQRLFRLNSIYLN